MKITIDQGDMAGLQTAMSGIKNGTERVLTQAINATVKTMKTQTRMRIGNELNLTAARIAKDLTTKKASFGHLSGAVIARGRPVGLVSFGAKKYGGGRGKGIAVKVKRSGSRAKLKHAFILDGMRGNTPGSSGNRQVFFRQMKGGKRVARYEVRTLHGPRIEDIFASDKVRKPLETQAAHLLARNIDKGIADTLRRFG
ncbi:phage tail protein [Desulfoluna spongiiphila]|uniref:phage tail protein n=1 Tax=Desulfoluna spongiiphila TaxID=419481 RepID=UPI00125FF7CA|nr:phage tail protein [Desulfoluna spongiiphila]